MLLVVRILVRSSDFFVAAIAAIAAIAVIVLVIARRLQEIRPTLKLQHRHDLPNSNGEVIDLHQLAVTRSLADAKQPPESIGSHEPGSHEPTMAGEETLKLLPLC